MIKLFLTAGAMASMLTISAQSLEKNVGHFNKVVASPKINIILVPGDAESVKINYSGIEESKINVEVKNNTLSIYLDKSRYTEKRQRVRRDGWEGKESIYRDANLTAYVTYRHLEKLVIRGESVADLQGETSNSKFKLSAYGECDITLASLQTDKFKASLYGQNSLRVMAGNVSTQKFKLFGENKVDTKAISGDEITSTTYGQSRLRLNAKDHVKLNTFGESDVSVNGSPELDKFTLGQVSIRK
jgi:hypothetical protein